MSDVSMDTKKVVKPSSESQEAGKRVGEAVAEAMKSASSKLVMPGHNKDVATEKKITVPLGPDGSTSSDIRKNFYSHNYENKALEISKSIGAIINSLPNKQDKNKALANELTKSAIKGLLSGVDPVVEKIIEDAKKHPALNK